MPRKQRPRPRDEVYNRLLELPGIDAATIAERAGMSRSVIEEMARGRLRWDGQAMEAARELFDELHGDDPEKVGYRYRDHPDVGEVFHERLLPGGEYVLRLTAAALRNEAMLDLRLWPLPRRFGAEIEKTGIGLMLTPEQWHELQPAISAAESRMLAAACQ